MSFWNQFADSIQATHDSRVFLVFPQVPGKVQYLKLLDDGIKSYLQSDDGDAKQTLEKVAANWEALTEALGRQSQVKHLRDGSGI